MEEHHEDYGPCCICESHIDVRNIIQLDYKVKSESGWGCVQCGLPTEGQSQSFVTPASKRTILILLRTESDF